MNSYSKLFDFVNYVWSFYNPQSDLYPIKGLTKQDIFDAFFIYRDRILKGDRERVRDIILEKPQFSWSH